MFVSNLFGPWQETFADAGHGDWGGGRRNHLGPFSTFFSSKLENFKQFRTNSSFLFICSYIQKRSLNLIETLNTLIYSPKHTKTRKYIPPSSNKSRTSKSIFSRNKGNENVYFLLHYLYFMLRATQQRPTRRMLGDVII